MGTLVVMLAWSTAGCSGPAAPPGSLPTPARSTTSDRTANRTGHPYCTVPLPQAWLTALQAGVGAVRPATSIGFAVAPNGAQYFASIHSPSWSGVAAVNLATGVETKISQYPDPPQDQAIYGAFDGRWLVWAEGYSLSNEADWAMLAWDSTSGSILTLYAPSDGGASPTDPIATIPSVQNGVATWTEESDNLSYVHLYDLNTRTDRVIYRGTAALGSLWGSDVLLTIGTGHHSDRFVAYSTSSHKEVSLPPALARVRGITYLAATSSEVVWAGKRSQGTWIWRRGFARAQQVSNSSGYAEFFGEAASDFIWTEGNSGSVVADPSTGSISRFPFRFPEVTAAGEAILVGYAVPGHGKTANPLWINSVLNVATLPHLRRCNS